uniref:Uncharacterized protein n=1 Tax=Rhizophora mucronata TaxID=61149 RepID=A0A2P2Q5V9_RHIMU
MMMFSLVIESGKIINCYVIRARE